MRTIGKILQVAGLVILPIACLQDLQGVLGRTSASGSGVATMLALMVFGALAFGLGRYIEGYSQNAK